MQCYKDLYEVTGDMWYGIHSDDKLSGGISEGFRFNDKVAKGWMNPGRLWTLTIMTREEAKAYMFMEDL